MSAQLNARHDEHADEQRALHAEDVQRDGVADREFHPAADLFPLMDEAGDDFIALVADVEQHGLRQPIAVLDGRILDGRNRLRACRLAGVAPQFTTLPHDTDPIPFVLSLNLHRRHLTREQRAALVGTLRERGWSIRTIAKAIGVSPSTVHGDARGPGVQDRTPERVTGLDGKRHPAQREMAESDRVAANDSHRIKREVLNALDVLNRYDLAVVAMGIITNREPPKVEMRKRIAKAQKALERLAVLFELPPKAIGSPGDEHAEARR